MEYDYKRIGRNIKHIRNALGKDYYDFGQLFGWSDSQVQKIESGHTTNGTINHKTLFDALPILARIGLCTYDDILWGDLSYLEKNSLANLPRDDEDDFSLFDNKDLNILGSFAIETYAPIINSPLSKDDPLFEEGMNIFVSRIKDNPDAKHSDIIKSLNCFSKYFEATNDPVGAVNTLSLFVYHWVLYIYGNVKIPSNDASYASWADKVNDIKFKEAEITERRKNFFSKHNGYLTRLMRVVRESKDYSDFAYYYLFVRYDWGILDRNITHLNEAQEKLFSMSYFNCLVAMGNKYALGLKEYLKDVIE